jgi:hypothetical protein
LIREAEGSRGKPREAEGSRGKPREAEGSRGKPRVALIALEVAFDAHRQVLLLALLDSNSCAATCGKVRKWSASEHKYKKLHRDGI